MVAEALRIMGIGVGMVFAVLTVLYLMIRALIKLFPHKKKEE